MIKVVQILIENSHLVVLGFSMGRNIWKVKPRPLSHRLQADTGKARLLLSQAGSIPFPYKSVFTEGQWGSVGLSGAVISALLQLKAYPTTQLPGFFPSLSFIQH